MHALPRPLADYRTPGATRATAVSLIVGAHALVAAALISIGGIEAIREARPIFVQLIEAPRPRSVEVPRPVPLPALRTPQVTLAAPPPIENLSTMRLEDKPPAVEPEPIAIAPAADRAPDPAPVIEPPRADMAYLDNPPPSYPALSKRAGEQGRVLLRVRVDARGQVEEIRVHATSGFPRLDEAALAAVRRWRFAPARQGDRAVPGWAVVPVTFALR